MSFGFYESWPWILVDDPRELQRTLPWNGWTQIVTRFVGGSCDDICSVLGSRNPASNSFVKIHWKNKIYQNIKILIGPAKWWWRWLWLYAHFTFLWSCPISSISSSRNCGCVTLLIRTIDPNIDCWSAVWQREIFITLLCRRFRPDPAIRRFTDWSGICGIESLSSLSAIFTFQLISFRTKSDCGDLGLT